MVDIPQSVRDRLESLPHVVGTAVGKRRVDGEKTDETCVVVFVDRKVAETQLADEEIVPETVDCDGEELATDVQEVGDVTALSVEPAQEAERTERVRPAPAGVSMAHPSLSAGTMGSTALEAEDGEPVVLSNAHVAAPEPQASEGDPVLQPGPEDGGTEGDEIGRLREWSEISSAEPNTTDSALIAVDPDDVDDEVLGVGPLAGFSEPDMESDETYTKSGRTTGVTTGELRGRDARIEVGGFGGGVAVFEGVDLFTSMGDGGDSGSLIGVDDGEFRATNLLFAGSPDATIGIPIEAVEAEHGELSVIDGDGGTGGDEDGDEGDEPGAPGGPDDPTGGFEGGLRERLEAEYGDVREEEGAFRVGAWPLDLLVVPGEDPGWAAERARGSDADAAVIAVPAGTEGELPAIPAGVAVVEVDP
ncbi:hypothetical protein [Halalkalicoccus tibetensis]|uniref:Nal1 N-terminal domain-containing protein n=1 Tax=Halalkalicoccus tibetensis TaxID=175632 RepID=A0ABD5V5L9_9EURY